MKENFGFRGKAIIRKGLRRHDGITNGIRICTAGGEHSYFIDLTPKRARELFEAGIQMCDELEQEGK